MIISILRPYIWNALLMYSVRPVIVRAISSGLSEGIFALATRDRASSMPLENPPMRTATRIVSPVTPGDVSPPLAPENMMHGGEYGSLGICSGRSAQPPTLVGPAAAPPAPPSLLPAPAPPPPCAAATAAASSAAAFAAASSSSAAISSSLSTSESKSSRSPSLPDAVPYSESSIDATATSFCWLGTSTAIARNTAAKPISGP